MKRLEPLSENLQDTIFKMLSSEFGSKIDELPLAEFTGKLLTKTITEVYEWFVFSDFWEPIETAPKNTDIRILGYRNNHCGEYINEPEVALISWNGEYWELCLPEGGEFKPSHWMRPVGSLPKLSA